jgi:hypothetical protein
LVNTLRVLDVPQVVLIVGVVMLLVYIASQVFGLTLLPFSIGGFGPENLGQRGRNSVSSGDQKPILNPWLLDSYLPTHEEYKSPRKIKQGS